MEGISRAAGVGPTITLCENTFHVKGRILKRYAEIEAEIIKHRGSPFDHLKELKNIFADDKELLLETAKMCFQIAKTWRFVTADELSEWLNNTISGRVFLIYLCVQHNDPTLTLEKVSELYFDELENAGQRGGQSARNEKIAEIERAINQASGDDQLGNLTGLGKEAEQMAASTGE